jgi:acyl dehydratase
MKNPEWAIAAGERVSLGKAILSRDDIIAFASEFDAQPFHLDDSAAETTLLGGLAASGWHTCVTVMGLLRQTLEKRALAVEPAGAEEIIWLKPVRPADQLAATLVWGSRSCAACGDHVGAFPASLEAVNQHDEPVIRWRMDCLARAAGAENGGPSRLAPECPLRKARPPRALRRPGDHGIKFFEHVASGDDIDLGHYEFKPELIRRFRSNYEGIAGSAASDVEPQSASAWHVVAAWMQCIVRYYGRHTDRLQREGRSVPMLGPAAGVKHLRWHRRVRPGETISFRAWAERKIELASHEDWGLLVVGAEGVDECGDPVVSFYPQMLLERASRLRHKSIGRRA